MSNNHDKRLASIQNWLKHYFETADYDISPASSDASFRRYFRVQYQGKSWIVMDAPPEHEDIRPFTHVAKLLATAEVNVPTIFAQDVDNGFLLLEDFGQTDLLSILNVDNVDHYYQLAIDAIIKMQRFNIDSTALPSYDKTLLETELNLFPDWFLNRHLDLDAPDFLSEINALLINAAIEQPQVFVHRDYHSRNLMVSNNSLGIIDFQDAVIGSLSYDLVSLLRDCYIEWPQTKIDEWLAYYHQLALKHGLLEIDIQTMTRWFDLMGLQRHLKVLGIFCRLYYRDGKAGYLKDLPLTLKYVLQITGKYPEFDPLHRFLVSSPKVMAVL